MARGKTRQPKPEERPEFIPLRKAYDLVLWAVFACMFVLSPIALLFTSYPHKLH